MAEGMNKAILLGNLGQEPECKFTQGGTAVLTLRMATQTSWYDSKAKERKEQTEWHTVKVFGPRAEALNKILSKGSRLLVEGRITTRSWEDKKSGDKRYATEITADNVLLCDGKRDGGERRPRREEPEQESFEDPEGDGQEGYF